jgi:hypothetical protein
MNKESLTVTAATAGVATAAEGGRPLPHWHFVII